MGVSVRLIVAAIAFTLVGGCGNKSAGNRSDQQGNQAATASGPTAAQPPAGPNIQLDTEALTRACIDPADASRPLSDFTPEQLHEMVGCANRQAAAQIRPRLPMRIDNVTTLETVTAADTAVNYTYRIDLDAGNVSPDVRGQLEQTIRASVCAQANMRQTMTLGGTYNYTWLDRSGEIIDRLEIDRC